MSSSSSPSFASTPSVDLPGPKIKGRRIPIKALNIADWATGFQPVIPYGEKYKSKNSRRAYTQWIKLFGPPKVLKSDQGRVFDKDFAIKAEADGTEIGPSSLESPSQRGITERAVGVFKVILDKAEEDYGCETLEDYLELVDITNMVKNRLFNTCGWSPIQ